MLSKESSLKINQKNSGFTLVELLIVIAILGVLATVVLLVINPAEQFARTRDAARKSTMGQMFRAEQAYFTSHGGAYSGFGNTWIDTLSASGELKQAPPLISYSITANNIACTPANRRENNYCYVIDGVSAADVVMYVTLESSSEQSKCGPAGAGNPSPYFVWESKTGTTCLQCLTAAPTQSGGTCNPVQ